jgi:hypothetical protein
MKKSIFNEFNIVDNQSINFPAIYSFLEPVKKNQTVSYFESTPSKVHQAKSIYVVPFYKPISKF